MGDGKKGLAPCGCIGEAVIGQYYECPKHDDVDFVLVVHEALSCVQCGSMDIDEDFQMDPIAFWFNPNLPIVDTRCNTCGRCWAR